MNKKDIVDLVLVDILVHQEEVLKVTNYIINFVLNDLLFINVKD